MGLNLNTADIIAAAAAAAAGVNNSDKPRKPTAKVWLNPGITVDFGGEDGATFVGLAQGLPVDTMDEAKTNYSNPKMRALGTAKNALKAKIMKACEGRAPGETFMINLQCQVRIVNEDSAAPAEGAEADAVSTALDSLVIG